LRLAMLTSDYLIWGLTLVIAAGFCWGWRRPHWRKPWRHILMNNGSAAAAVVLAFYVIIGLIDSIHFQVVSASGVTELRSGLDLLVQPLGEQNEQTYSAPFANHLFVRMEQQYPPLIYASGNLADILLRAGGGVFGGLITAAIFYFVLLRRQNIWREKTAIAGRAIIVTLTLMWILVWTCGLLATHYHILGTDKIGRDVFYQTIKSIRTGLMIGALTTLFTLPFALLLGTIAGYFRGWVDDIIQYVYTTLSSIPGVLLISAAVLVLQVHMANHAAAYPTIAQRADVRLLALCFILAITGWASLCRFLRGETLKLRELEYVQAARALGVTQIRIILRHIIPNVFHIVIITLVLDFSLLVLAEAMLSYVGVGVDPTTISWGNMINSSRLELAREPMVWWPLLAALIAMFGLVLAINIFADAVRDAYDPYLRKEP
jgi:peptide/nickel transport system permease protein